jgi:hypothetical protein
MNAPATPHIISGRIKHYRGYAAAQGSHYGFTFENKNKKDASAISDYGIGIANVNYSQDAQGKFTLSLIGSYFQPDYKSDAKKSKVVGSRGTFSCTKTDA